jgi:outer membrane murein-binding lipoprotein Lpp
MRLLAVAVVVAVLLPGCTRAERDTAGTPLPTRQTTIDPVNKKLDAAAQDVERRRQDIDNAAK